MSLALWVFGTVGATIAVLYVVAIWFAVWTMRNDSRRPPSRGDLPRLGR